MSIPVEEESQRPGRAPEDREFFMIADFGLTRFRRSTPNASSGVPFEYGTSTYRAPECNAGTKVGRAGDIWSLGCIFSEVITFALLGFKDGVDEFRKRRSVSDRRDLFHGKEKVKPEVLNWFSSLVDLGRDDTFIRDFIGLIVDMLHEDPKQRPKIGEVEQKLEEILKAERRKLGFSIATTKVTIIAQTSAVPPSVSITHTKTSWMEFGGSLMGSVLKNFKTPGALTPHDSENISQRRRSISHGERIEAPIMHVRSVSDCPVASSPDHVLDLALDTPNRQRTYSLINNNISQQPLDMEHQGTHGSYRTVARQVPIQQGNTQHRRHGSPSLPTPANSFSTISPSGTPTSTGSLLSTKSLHDLEDLLKILGGFDTVLLTHVSLHLDGVGYDCY